MRRHYRAIALAIFSLAATAALAQTSTAAGANANPVARGEHEFFYGPLNGQQRGQAFGRGFLDNTGIARPNPRSQQQVTPVPEPSQWAMMLAGLALVGFIVHRGSRSPRELS
jgi:hypothetical protein